MAKWLVIAMLVIAAPVMAADKQWAGPVSKLDVGLAAAVTVVMWMDYKQTLVIADNPDRYRENNYFMQGHPSRSQVTTVFAVEYVTIMVSAYLLPKPWREILLVGTIANEAYVVENNRSIGLKIRF